MNHLSIVIEDELSEYVIRKMVEFKARSFNHITPMGKRGNGYIKSKINNFNQLPNSMPFFIFTDLDNYECPVSLIQDWIKLPIRENLVFRVAVREVEVWLLADEEGFSKFVRLNTKLVEKETREIEKLKNPKEKLISLVNRSKIRELIEDIVTEQSNVLKQGKGYNSRLKVFVDEFWDIDRARNRSESLNRAICALEELEKRIA